MKKLLFISKTLLCAILLCAGATNAWGDCAVTTDTYGKTQIVWDFGIAAKDGGATYYLNASSNAYEDASTTYGTARKYYTTAKIKVASNRAINPTGTSDDKGAGVVIGKDEGYIEFYAPVSGTLTVTGKYLTNLTIADKSASTTTTGSSSTVTTATVTAGHRIQLYASSGTGVATMTLTPTGYETDNVTSGTNDFSALKYFLAEAVIPKGTYVFTSNGYKSISGIEDVKDHLVIYTESTGGTADDATIDKSEETYRGVKIGGNSKNEYDYTTSVNGTLTITYNYGGDRGTQTIVNTGGGSITTSEDATLVASLSAGQRLQVVAGTSGIYIKSVSFVPTTVTATIGSTGYTTFSSSYPLNLSGISGGTAYYASAASGSTVTLTSTTATVPAGTGLIIGGTAGATVTIPVAASASEFGTNLLVGCPTEKALEANAASWVLVNNSGTAEFQSLKTNGATIPAGKAYLSYTASGARSLKINFGDVTGVNAVEAASEAAQKDGKYFENGQIVIVKNGKKYNAAGALLK